MKKSVVLFAVIVLSGCSLLPRPHDPVMFDHLVTVDIAVNKVNCDAPDWKLALTNAEQLSRYTTWRGDPQSENLAGLEKHINRMNQGGSKAFCELGKRTAAGRINAAKTAWEKR